MNDDDRKGADAPLPDALRSRADFDAAVRGLLRHAIGQRSRRLTWLDPDFTAWPLGDPALLHDLTAWLKLPQRRLVLVACHFDEVPRQHPRFVAWRRDWSHAVEAWAPVPGADVRMPTLAIDDDRLCLQLFDRVQWRGRLALDEQAVRRWRDEIDALLQRAEPAFPAHQIGL
jgi:hypothetical protein